MKFIEPVEGDQERKTKDKFKILSLPMAADKVEELSSYASELVRRIIHVQVNPNIPTQLGPYTLSIICLVTSRARAKVGGP